MNSCRMNSPGSGHRFVRRFPITRVDNNALYIGATSFDNGYYALDGAQGDQQGFVINKADLLAGTLTVTPFRRMGSNLGGIFLAAGCDCLDSSVSSGFSSAQTPEFGNAEDTPHSQSGWNPGPGRRLHPDHVPSTGSPFPSLLRKHFAAGRHR